MGLNKVNPAGNMYQFLNEGGYRGATWNPIKGKCAHACSYCYMDQERLKPLRLDEKDLRTDLGNRS